MQQRIFIAHIVPQDKILKYNLSVASCNFSYNLINGGCFDKVYSVLPTFVHGEVDQFDGLVYSSIRKHRILSRFAPMAENLSLFWKIPRTTSVWYYNCTILNATLIVLLKLFKPNVRQQMIILDYTPSRKPMERFFLWLTNRMDGTIRLADSPLFTIRNSVCLPGVVPNDGVQHPRVTVVKKEFLISGALGDNIAMLPLLLDVFSRIPELILHITGKAPNVALVERYTKVYPNIIYHGIVEYEEYLRILHNTPFLLSTRNPKYPENLCNFPSKIIEALLHNRIIISTLHYGQLEGIRYLKVPAEANGLRKSLQSIVSMKQAELLLYANQSDEVRDRFNCEVWKVSMNKIEKKYKRI